MVRFNVFTQEGAVTRDAQTGRYRVDFNKMTRAIDALSARLLMIQGDGDYAAAEQLTSSMGRIGPTLAADLKKLDTAHIRSEEHTSELQSLMRISYAVFCLKKKNTETNTKYKPRQHNTLTETNLKTQKK